jgi:hypothetical protein
MASGTKVFTNNSGSTLNVTLFVRRGDNPGNQAGTVIFQLGNGQSFTQSYGSDTNSVFLDGIAVEVVTRGSAIDDLLNTNSKIAFTGGGNAITITGSN